MTKRVRLVIIIAACVLVLALPPAVINIYVVGSTAGDIFEVGGRPMRADYDCILVLGAGLRPDGTPSDMLKDRLITAIELYEAGFSDLILLSGDCSGADYDEVSAMRAYCLSNGIPEEAIVCDNFGFSTYESVCNANENGYERVIIVTQKYHLYRALYIAGEMNIDAVGVSADVRSYRGQTMRDLREIAARVKDFFMVI